MVLHLINTCLLLVFIDLFQVTCSNCADGETLTYLWNFIPFVNVQDKPSINWETETLTGQYGQSLVVKAEHFPSNLTASYIFKVTG